MNDVWLQIGLVLDLVIFNSLFAGSEIAPRLCQGSRSSRRRAGGSRFSPGWLATPTAFCRRSKSASPWGGFLASATAAVSLARPLIDSLEPLFGELTLVMGSV
jgi:putative hemolysin